MGLVFVLYEIASDLFALPLNNHPEERVNKEGYALNDNDVDVDATRQIGKIEHHPMRKTCSHKPVNHFKRCLRRGS